MRIEERKRRKVWLKGEISPYRLDLQTTILALTCYFASVEASELSVALQLADWQCIYTFSDTAPRREWAAAAFCHVSPYAL